MKVLHIYRNFFPDALGGISQTIRQVCKATRKYGIESQVFTLSARPNPKVISYEGIRVTRSRSWAAPFSCNLGGVNSFKTFRKLAKESDIIHFHFPWPAADFYNLLVPSNKHKIMTWHSDIVRQSFMKILYHPLLCLTLRKMDTIIATSPNYAATSRFLNNEAVSKKLKIIPLGVDELDCKKEQDKSIFKKIRISSKELYFLFVGCTRYYKGLKYLIEAASLVHAKILIAGSGPELIELKRKAFMKKAKNIVFVGSVSEAEKNSLMMNCRAFVLPSHKRSEAYGMVLVEASIWSKPMVTCEIGTGTSFVNIKNKTGLVVEPENPYALSEALNTLLVKPNLALKMGLAARKRYEENFTSQKMGLEYANLYKQRGL